MPGFPPGYILTRFKFAIVVFQRLSAEGGWPGGLNSAFTRPKSDAHAVCGLSINNKPQRKAFGLTFGGKEPQEAASLLSTCQLPGNLSPVRDLK